MLRDGTKFLVRVRSGDGAESVTVPNNSRLLDVYPMFLKRVVPFFLGKDARDLESLLWEVYRDQSNYKFQGLAFWVCVATVEMALLDLMGQISGKPIGELLGGVRRRDIGVYRASGNRGNTPEAEIEYLQRIVAETGAKAVKFRLGGRMSKNADSLPGRSEALIPLVRKTFGDAMTLYADSNSSYDVPNAIRIGRLMEEHKYAMFEEPCEFDDLWATKQVSDALTIPVGLGEQEFSMRRFQWVIENRAADIIQPDLHYFGGYIRCTKVARMAAAAGMPCTLHLSESGFAYLNVLHFASYVADPGAFPGVQRRNGHPLHVRHVAADLQERHRALSLRAGLRNPDRSGLRAKVQAGQRRLSRRQPVTGPIGPIRPIGPILFYTTWAVKPQSWQKSRTCSL